MSSTHLNGLKTMDEDDYLIKIDDKEDSLLLDDKENDNDLLLDHQQQLLQQPPPIPNYDDDIDDDIMVDNEDEINLLLDQQQQQQPPIPNFEVNDVIIDEDDSKNIKDIEDDIEKSILSSSVIIDDEDDIDSKLDSHLDHQDILINNQDIDLLSDTTTPSSSVLLLDDLSPTIQPPPLPLSDNTTTSTVPPPTTIIENEDFIESELKQQQTESDPIIESEPSPPPPKPKTTSKKSATTTTTTTAVKSSIKKPATSTTSSTPKPTLSTSKTTTTKSSTTTSSVSKLSSSQIEKPSSSVSKKATSGSKPATSSIKKPAASRPSTSSTTTTTKPSATTTTTTTTPKPSTSSASSIPKPTTTTTSKTAAKPAAKSTTKPAASSKITTTTTPKPTISTAKKPAASSTTTTIKPTSTEIKDTKTETSKKPTTTTTTATATKPTETTTPKPTTSTVKKPAGTTLKKPSSSIKKTAATPSSKTTTTTTTTPKPSTTTTTTPKPTPSTSKTTTISTLPKPTTSTTTTTPKPSTTTTTTPKPTPSTSKITTTTKPSATTTTTTTTTTPKPTTSTTTPKPTTTTTTTTPKPTSTTSTVPAKPKSATTKKSPATKKSTPTTTPSSKTTTTNPSTLATKTPTSTTTSTTTAKKSTPTTTPSSTTKSPTPTIAIKTTKPISTTSTTTNLTTSISTLSISDTPKLINGTKSRPSGPQNRKKATGNPVKNLQSTAGVKSTTTSLQQKTKSNLSAVVTGFGLLASVGASDSAAQAQLSEFKSLKLHSTSTGNLITHRLIRCSGRKNIIPVRVSLSVKSIRSTCCFVLDAKDTIYEWRGSKSNKMQIAKAMDLAGRIKNKEHSGRPNIVVVEESKPNPNVDSKFWQLLEGVQPKTIPEESKEELEAKPRSILYKIKDTKDAKGNQTGLTTEMNKEKKLMRANVTSQDCFILDCGSELYLWLGKSSDPFVKKNSYQLAQELLTKRKGRPQWVVVEKIPEGTETELFKDKFYDWTTSLPISMAPIPNKGRIADIKKIEFNIESMFQPKPPPEYFTKEIDDGSGSIQIWRVKDHDKEFISDQSQYGHFYDGESYVILYKYQKKNRDQYIIYFWQGKNSTINEKGSSALLTVDLDDSIGGVATQIRVVQNKEPVHFIKIFGGFIIVHKGIQSDVEKRFQQVNEPKIKIYQLRQCHLFGTEQQQQQYHIRVLESNNEDTLNFKFNSNDIYIIESLESIYIWKGQYSSTLTSNNGQLLQNIILNLESNSIYSKLIDNNNSRSIVILNESQGSIILKQQLLNNDKEIDNNVDNSIYKYSLEKLKIKLFQCSVSSGSYKAEIVCEWDQDDLDNEDVMILDAVPNIFVWIGRNSTLDERSQSMKTAITYSNHVQAGSEEPIVVYLVYSGQEPSLFTRYFHCWDDRKTIKSKVPKELVLVKDYLAALDRTYTLEELTHRPPPSLDKGRLESYLSDEEFLQVFKMDKSQFAELKTWKQEQLKKPLGLY
eukprot:gene8457-10388_t